MKSPSRAQSVPRLCLNRAEVALAIGVSPNSIDEMVREGRLPPPRRWHTRNLWLVSEIEAYAADWPTNDETGHAPSSSVETWNAVA